MALLVILGFFVNSQTIAQTENNRSDTDSPDTTYIITTNDGGEFIGRILSDDGREVVITTSKQGKIILPKYVIKSMEVVSKSNYVGNMAVVPNPHPSRYVFAPSAFALKKGEGYVNAFYFFIWQAQYGITDNFSLGLTTSWLLAPTFLNAKYTIPVDENLTFAIGGQVGKLYITDENSVALGFGTLTYGNTEANISVNMGYGAYANSGMFIATASANKRLGKSASFMAEFWYCQPNNSQPFMMGGPALRLYSGRKATFDIAVTAIAFKERYYNYYYPGNGSFEEHWNAYYPIPMLSISYKL